MDYYKVVSDKGAIACITPIKKVAQDVLSLFPSNYRIVVIKGDVSLLHNL